MRKVMVLEYVFENKKRTVVEKGMAYFHGFGVDCQEFDNGPGNYSTAIVEWPDGSVQNVYVNLIKFLSPIV